MLTFQYQVKQIKSKFDCLVSYFFMGVYHHLNKRTVGQMTSDKRDSWTNVWWLIVSHQKTVSHTTLRWRRNGHGGVSNHQPHHCLLNRLFGCRSKKTSKLHVTGLCAGNSPGTGEFPAQMASNAENVFIWWRHHVSFLFRFTAKWEVSTRCEIINSLAPGRL